MSQSRGRWVINIVLVLAVIAFVGVSMIPLLTSTVEQSQPSPVASPLPSGQATPASQQSQLQDQARGFELVLQREPNNQTALQGLADARINLGDIKGAISPIEKLAQLNPTQSQYKLLLAQARLKTGDFAGANQAYKEILKTNPGDSLALQGLVIALLQQEQPEEAISVLQDTLANAPKTNQAQAGSVDTTSVQLLLGEVYASQKRYDDAIATYDKAIADDKQDVRPLLAKASLFVIQKRYDDAIALYDRAIALDAKDFRPVLAKASVLKEQGKNDQAKPLFESAAALAPTQYKQQIQQIANQPASPTPTASPSPTTTKTP